MRRLGALLASAVLLAGMATVAVRSPATDPPAEATAAASTGELGHQLQAAIDTHTARQAELTAFYAGVQRAENERQAAIRAEALHRAAAQRAAAERASRSARRTSAPAVHPAIGTCDTSSWQACIASLSWSVGTAMAIVRCESGGNPNARNRRSSATGLFQILGGPTDPIANVMQAYSMWRSRGWQPWNASRSCWA